MCEPNIFSVYFRSLGRGELKLFYYSMVLLILVSLLSVDINSIILYSFWINSISLSIDNFLTLLLELVLFGYYFYLDTLFFFSNNGLWVVCLVLVADICDLLDMRSVGTYSIIFSAVKA